VKPQRLYPRDRLWLWFTVLFANFAEALAEGRSRAQAASLRGMKRETVAKLLQQPHGAAWLPTARRAAQGRWCDRGRRHAVDGT
jgi:high-affinity K+ transport system ATPase subunit B